MVSFQCDSCQDVVKKPKLDQHHSRGCGASFTCIDCSKTFATPADWKGHTTCISESQKYEKSMYRPKVNGHGGREYPAGASNGKFQGRGGSWARPPQGRPVYRATGANGTPLGTPTRMSPVTTPAPANEPKSTSAPTTAVTTESTKEKEEKRSHKKRKVDELNDVVVEAPKQTVPTEEEEPKFKEKKDKKDKKEKKEKKEKKDKHKKAVAAEKTEVNGSADTSHDAALPSSLVTVDESKKSKKSKKEERKKGEAEVDTVPDVSEKVTTVDATTNGDDVQEKKKKKKKKQKSDEDPADVDASMADVATTQLEEKKKSKKRKREAEGETEPVKDVTEGEAETGKKIKKKKKTSTS